MIRSFIFLLFTFLITNVLFAQQKEQMVLMPEGTFHKNYIEFPTLNAKGTFDARITSVEELKNNMGQPKRKNIKAIYRSEGGNRSGILMGSWDLNGDGKEQMVFNYGHYIKVLQPGGSAKSYSTGNKWALMRSAVCDGDEGLELPLNMGGHIKIIKDKDQSTRDYRINNGSWALMAACDTDGVIGNEIICNIGAHIQIINNRTHKSKQYHIRSGSWALLSGGVCDLDGRPGNELAFNAGGSAKVIINSRQKSQEYSIGIPWALVGITDHDEAPGQEILYRRAGLWAICQRTEKTYFITSREEISATSKSRGNCPKCEGTGKMPVLCPHFKRFVLKCTNGCRTVTCETCTGSGSVPPGYIGCPRCKGRGMIGTCSRCGYVLWCSHGANWNICGTCDKTGIVSSENMACPRCKGKGEISYCNSCGKKFLATCSHGLKWTGCGACEKGLITTEYFPCPRCKGRGEYMYCPACRKEVLTCSHNSINHYLICKTCNKTGRVSNNYKTCPICKGSGKRGEGICIVCSGKGVIENIGD